MKQRINIVKFARHLELAVSAVSKALNDYGNVSEATKRRVLEAAARFGFSPDPAGRRLRRQASDTIGFVPVPPDTRFSIMGSGQTLVHWSVEARARGAALGAFGEYRKPRPPAGDRTHLDAMSEDGDGLAD